VRAGREKSNNTKSAVLNTAERLFAAHGFKATSLRAITSEAQANLGAVNYHFRTKDDLILAVLRRRMRPLNAERLALLDRFETEANGRAVKVEKILEALFRPPLELIARDRKSGRYFIRLIAQCLVEPGAFLQPLIQEEFAERNRRFHGAMARALPQLSSEEVHWRLHFAHGVFLHTLANSHVLELSSRGRCRIGNSEAVLHRIIAFCASGCRARGERKGEKS
jgi:AcrR family transcriptional regulator